MMFYVLFNVDGMLIFLVDSCEVVIVNVFE